MTTIYAAMRNSLLVVTGEEGDWTSARRLDEHDLECVAVSPDEPNRLFVGTFDAGLQRSTDGGDSFERVGATVIDTDHVMSAAVSPHEPEEVWVGTEPSAAYRSKDGGGTFEERPGITDLPSEPEWFFPPRPDTHHVRWIEPDPNEPDRVYLGIELGAFIITEDAGESWRERPPGSRRDNHSLATHPAEPGRIYSAAGDGYAESDDWGESWAHPQDGLEHRYCWSVVPDPGDPDTVLVSSAHGAGSAHRAGNADTYVYRKRAGEPWECLDDHGLPAGTGVLRAVLAPGGSGGELYAANNRGIYRTRNAGGSWDRLDVEWPEAFGGQTVRGLAVIA